MRTQLQVAFLAAMLAPLVAMAAGCFANDDPPASAGDDAGTGSTADDGGVKPSNIDLLNDGGASADAEPTGPPAVRYVGRFDTSADAGPRVGWAGARVIVRFSGTSLTASITEEELYRGPSHYDVLIDDKLEAKPFVPADGAKDHVLASGLAAGTHVVELRRRTETSVGITQFRGFTFGGGSSSLRRVRARGASSSSETRRATATASSVRMRPRGSAARPRTRTRPIRRSSRTPSRRTTRTSRIPEKA